MNPISTVQPAVTPREDPKLREAAQDMESLFVTQMLQAMRQTVPESGLLGSGSGQKLFRDMLDQELAKEISHGSGLGIGEMLYRQLAPAEGENESLSPVDGSTSLPTRDG